MLFNFDVDGGRNTGAIVDRLGELAGMGFDVAHGSVKDVATIEPIEIIGRDIIPAAASL